MKQNHDRLVSGLSVLVATGFAACNNGGSSNGLLPNAMRIDASDVIVAEGDTGTTSFDFMVTLSEPHDTPMSVSFATADGTAQNEAGDGDYQSTSGTITFEPGTTTQVVSVPVYGDLQHEADETFSLILSNATAGAHIGDGEGVGTILDQDAAFSIDDVTAMETDVAVANLDFTVTLEAPLDQVVFVDYATQDGTAQSSPFQGDFRAVSGTLTFEPGTTQQTVHVDAFADSLSEFDENFFVQLSNATGPGASIADAQGIGTIVDDDRDEPLDGDPLTASWRPQIAASGSTLYVAWYDDRNGASDVYFRSSGDDGTNWNETARLDTDAPGQNASNGVRLCADGSNVYVAWIDSRNGASDVYFNSSNDFGQTWQASDVRLDTDAAGAASSTEVGIACSGSHVYVVWVDERDGAGDVRFNTSADGGTTWLANDLRIDTNAAGSTSSSEPRIAVGDQLDVVWIEDGDVYANHSEDNGATWSVSQIRVDRDPSAIPNLSGSPRVAVQGTNVYVVWQDDRNGAFDVYYNQSFDGGANFGPLDKRLDNGDLPGFRPSVAPEICADGFNVYVTWQDLRQLGNAFDDVYFNRSNDGGITWYGDRRIDYGDTDGKTQSENPAISCNGQTIAIVWSDARAGGPELDLYAATSVDGGESFGTHLRRLDSDAPGSAASEFPEVLAHDGQVFVVWEDQRFAGDVFFQAFEPH